MVIVKEDFAGLLPLVKGEEVFCVVDSSVMGLGEVGGFGGFGKAVLSVRVSEESKSLEMVGEVCRFLLESGATRDALVLAVGGGVVCDLVGFAAAVYMRGVRWGAVPTTLLAQVDAGIGGKTGVNLDGYKNMVGCFHQPEFTYINVGVLKGLAQREMRSGAAEMMKNFIIGDGARYAEAVRYFSEGVGELRGLVAAAAAVKTAAVALDPVERGAHRRLLNLGHTFAHAIEWRGAGLTHGEAVAVGVVQAALLSEKLGCCPPGLASRLASDFRSCGLPVDLPCPLSDLVPAMFKDKKSSSDGVWFVVIEQIGKVSSRFITKDQFLSLI